MSKLTTADFDHLSKVVTVEMIGILQSHMLIVLMLFRNEKEDIWDSIVNLLNLNFSAIDDGDINQTKFEFIIKST